MKIKQQLVSSQVINSSSFGYGNSKKYITIHQTGNFSKGANAQAHANLLSRGFSASWHWSVDDEQAIQSFPHEVKCWHAGDGHGSGNTESIGIELCVNSDGNYLQTLKNGTELVAKIMKDENISIENVVQHNHWSGKDCPNQIRHAYMNVSWGDFLEMVKKNLKGDDEEKPSDEKKLYLVQVGAFRVKENAVKLKEELEEKGYKPFIKIQNVDR